MRLHAISTEWFIGEPQVLKYAQDTRLAFYCKANNKKQKSHFDSTVDFGQKITCHSLQTDNGNAGSMDKS
jgi:hypothetical protein